MHPKSSAATIIFQLWTVKYNAALLNPERIHASANAVRVKKEKEFASAFYDPRQGINFSCTKYNGTKFNGR